MLEGANVEPNLVLLTNGFAPFSSFCKSTFLVFVGIA